jgi:hypothetical protein
LKAYNDKKDNLIIHLKNPKLFNVKNENEKLVFLGKIEDNIFISEYVLGENKELFMAFLDE